MSTVYFETQSATLKKELFYLILGVGMKNILSLFRGTRGTPPKDPSDPSETAEEPSRDVTLSVNDISSIATSVISTIHLEQRRRSRNRWLTFLAILGFIIGVMFLSSGKAPSNVRIDTEAFRVLPLGGASGVGHVAMIPILGDIEGDILGDPEFGNTTRYLHDALMLAEEHKQLSAVILYINSYGGDAVASAQGYRIIKEFRARTRIPVYAYVSSHAYSGGYYFALGANKIIIDPEASVGSIGVIIQYFNTAPLGKLFGIEDIEIATGELKACIGQWKKLSPACSVMLHREVNVAFYRFLRAVSDSRNIPFDVLLAESKRDDGRTNGSIFGSEDALANGLVDKVETLDELLVDIANEAHAKKPLKQIEFVRYDKKKELLERWSKETRTAFMKMFYDNSSSRSLLRAE